MYDMIKNDMNVESIVKLKEKEYPKDDHWNPQNKNYTASILDKENLRLDLESYNGVINGFKRDLKIQKEIIDYMQNMKRPYK